MKSLPKWVMKKLRVLASMEIHYLELPETYRKLFQKHINANRGAIINRYKDAELPPLPPSGKPSVLQENP